MKLPNSDYDKTVDDENDTVLLQRTHVSDEFYISRNDKN